MDPLNPTIQELTAAVEREGENMPDVGPLSALAFVLIIGIRSAFSAASRWVVL
jgi:hypothetical protein